MRRKGVAAFFGDTAALKALKDGEEHGAKEYERALEDEGIDDTTKEDVLSRLYLDQQRHIAVLDAMIDRLAG